MAPVNQQGFNKIDDFFFLKNLADENPNRCDLDFIRGAFFTRHFNELITAKEKRDWYN